MSIKSNEFRVVGLFERCKMYSQVMRKLLLSNPSLFNEQNVVESLRITSGNFTISLPRFSEKNRKTFGTKMLKYVNKAL